MSVYQKVLLAVDVNHEESWDKALPVAIGICREFGAELHVITAVPDLNLPMIANHFPEHFAEKIAVDLGARLTELVDTSVPAEIPSRHAVVAGNAIYRLILEYADEHAIDLIVLEAYQPDLKDFLLGSNAEKIARHAKQSVIIVRE